MTRTAPRTDSQRIDQRATLWATLLLVEIALEKMIRYPAALDTFEARTLEHARTHLRTAFTQLREL